MRFNIGKYKALFDRQRSYLAVVNFTMLICLFFRDKEIKWYYILALPIWFIFLYVDVKYIMPQEFKYLHGKSPVFKEILRRNENKSKKRF